MTDSKSDGIPKHNTPSRSGTNQGGLEAAREHRDDLEALAETDLPASKWAKRLLRLLDEHENGGDR